MMLVFTRPEYLILLFAIPALIFVHVISLKSVRKRAIKFANFEAISKIKGVEIFSKNLTVLYINIAVIILGVFAVSGIGVTKQVDISETSFVLAIDSSWSMSATDIHPSRIEAAKKAAVDLLKMLPEKTKIGIISFSGTAFIEQELTDDKEKVKDAINNIDAKAVGGTDILGAITSSATLLRNEKAKAIILISDGQANVNVLQDIVDYSNKNQITVHCLGIGTREGSTGETGAVFKISEDTLKTIAYNSEGKYYHIKDVEDFYSSLNEIVSVSKTRAVYDMSLYSMMAALALFILNFALINTRYRTLP